MLGSFDQAIQTYDSESLVQKQMAEKLWRMSQMFLPESLSRVVEFGAGTGHLSRFIAQAEPSIYELIDQSFGLLMKNQLSLKLSSKTQALFLVQNAEKINLASCTDLLIGNAVIQWFEDPLAWIGDCHEKLNSGSLLVFSSFGENHFYKLEKSFEQCMAKQFPSPIVKIESQKWRGALEKDWEILVFDHELMLQNFSSLREVLLHFRKSGVRSNQETFAISPSGFRCWEKIFKSMCGNRLYLEWDCVFVVLRKR
jgi:malonyl-CoA O-methyltransferase